MEENVEVHFSGGGSAFQTILSDNFAILQDHPEIYPAIATQKPHAIGQNRVIQQSTFTNRRPPFHLWLVRFLVSAK